MGSRRARLLGLSLLHSLINPQGGWHVVNGLFIGAASVAAVAGMMASEAHAQIGAPAVQKPAIDSIQPNAQPKKDDKGQGAPSTLPMGTQNVAPPSFGNDGARNNQNTTGNIIKTVRVLGAQKIEPATVLAYLPFKIGDRWSDTLGNDALRILNNTGLFALITLEENNGVVTVKIMESPVIDEVAFEGNSEVEDKDFLMVLAQNSNIKRRAIYSRAAVKKAVNIIQQVYLQRGFFQANVSPKLIDIGNNRVQLVFEINEGRAPRVGAFEFYGNNSFSDGALRNNLLSSVYNPLRFFSTTDRYDPNRIKTDQDNLLRFYRENGFVDAAVTSATTQLNKSREDFTITYSIKEGPRYRVDKINLTSNIKRIPIDKMKSYIAVRKGNYYKISSVEKTERDIVQALRDDYNYPFMRVVTKTVTHPDTQTVDVSFEVVQGQRQYINRIVIQGNGRTLDSIIRRKLSFAEGDPLDEDAVRRGFQAIQNTGYFSSVEPKLVPVPGRPDRVDVILKVQETSTGALNFSAGYSTKDGIIFGVTFGENNLLGTARILNISGQFAIPITSGQGKTFGQSYTIAYTEPFLADKDLAMTTSLYRTVNTNTANLLTQTRTGGSVGFRFNYNRYFSQYFYYNIYYNQLRNAAGGSNAEGNFLNSIFGQQISYDTRDNPNNPRSGLYATFGNDLAGLGGDIYYLRTSATAAGYMPIAIGLTNDPVLAVGIDAGYIFPFNSKTVSVADRFYLGGQNLRGFQDNAAGPSYTGFNAAGNTARVFVGGRQYFTQSTELRIPIDFLSDLGAKFIVFNDIGILSLPDEKGLAGIADDGGLRASWGLGGSFITPIGPIVISWAFPYKKGPSDVVQNFRIDFKSKF